MDLAPCKLVSRLWTVSSVDVHADFLLKALKEAGLRNIDWSNVCSLHPWGCFISEGAFKRVYRVWNSVVGAEQAVSVICRKNAL